MSKIIHDKNNTSFTLFDILLENSLQNNSKHKQFPHNLLMRDVLIQEERVLKAIEK